MKIIGYAEKYRDDMIFMVLEAKDALGRIPTINPDLLDISACYLSKGEPFWLAMDENDRVIGCVGYHAIPGSNGVRLQRLYVKAKRKRQGIGTALLLTAERAAKRDGKSEIVVHMGGKEYIESRYFYPKHGYSEYQPDWMKKEL